MSSRRTLLERLELVGGERRAVALQLALQLQTHGVLAAALSAAAVRPVRRLALVVCDAQDTDTLETDGQRDETTRTVQYMYCQCTVQ